MRLAIVVLAVALVFSVQGMNLLKQDFLDTHPNIEWVFFANINGTDYIGEELYSFEYNKVKFHYTSPSGFMPAFDALFDYTKGEMTVYLNLTGDCRKMPLETKDMKVYWRDVFYNHTEFAGTRGRLNLYEAKEVDRDARRWIYGYMAKTQDNKEEFVLKSMQVHNPYSGDDYTYEFVDGLSYPKVDKSFFEYPQCNEAPLENLDFSQVPSALAANVEFSRQVMINQAE